MAKPTNSKRDPKMSQNATATVEKQKKTPEQKRAEREARKAERKAEREAAKSALTPFRQSVDPSHLNSEGLLTSPDVAALGFDESKHLDLGREDFASESVYLVYRARELRQRGQRLIEKADQMEREAANASNVADPVKRAAIKKLGKMVGAMAELQKQLQSEGIDISAMLKTAGFAPIANG